MAFAGGVANKIRINTYQSEEKIPNSVERENTVRAVSGERMRGTDQVESAATESRPRDLSIVSVRLQSADPTSAIRQEQDRPG
ncbi:hypothetical protein J6590_006938 [Homalodisca vitripennis]|nr:hypothetical protein J6590_006938 [Homalodisca vitripennis]